MSQSRAGDTSGKRTGGRKLLTTAECLFPTVIKSHSLRILVLDLVSHLRPWTRLAGWGEPESWCYSPTSQPGTSTHRRPHASPPQWSSRHPRPGGGVSEWDQVAVFAWTTDSSTRRWHLTPPCTEGTHTHQQRCLTPAATQTRWLSSPLQKEKEFFIFCCFCLILLINKTCVCVCVQHPQRQQLQEHVQLYLKHIKSPFSISLHTTTACSCQPSGSLNAACFCRRS